jgi:hypothetical protein
VSRAAVRPNSSTLWPRKGSIGRGKLAAQSRHTRICDRALPTDRCHLDLPDEGEFVDRPPHQKIWKFDLHDVHLATPQAERRVELCIAEEFSQTLDPSDQRRHRLDPKPSVHFCVPWIVEPCDDPWHTEHLACQTREHHVRLIITRDGRQTVSPLDAGVQEHVTVEARSNDSLPCETCAESLKSGGILVHHRHGLATLTEALCQTSPNPTTPNNDAFHTLPHVSMKESRRSSAQACTRQPPCAFLRALWRTRALRPSSARSNMGAQANRKSQLCKGKDAVSKRCWNTGT